MKGHQWTHISDDAKDLVHRMLELDPGHRITIDDVLRHPWIRVGVWTATYAVLCILFLSWVDKISNEKVLAKLRRIDRQ